MEDRQIESNSGKQQHTINVKSKRCCYDIIVSDGFNYSRKSSLTHSYIEINIIHIYNYYILM